MLTLTTFITAPISSYLQAASKRIGLDLSQGELIPVDNWNDKEGIYQCNYRVVATDLSQLTENSPSYASVSIQYIDTIEREHSGGSSTLGHQIAIGVATRDYSDAMNVRDFTLNAIEYGLISGDLEFNHYSWTGSYSILTRTLPRLIESNRIYLCRSTVLVKLSRI